MLILFSLYFNVSQTTDRISFEISLINTGQLFKLQCSHVYERLDARARPTVVLYNLFIVRYTKTL